MATTLDIITSAFRKVGVTTFNDAPDSNEVNDALETLNQMVESWANDSLIIYARTEESFPLTGAQSYTVGSGQDFDTVPFTKIISVYARSGDLDYYLQPLDDAAYARIGFKNITTIPEYYNYNNGFPVATMKFYPVALSGYTLFVISEKPLTNFALTDTINLPPGWERALIYNLAIDIAPEYGQEVPAATAKVAAESLQALKSQVAKARGLDVNFGYDPATNNIYSGYNIVS